MLKKEYIRDAKHQVIGSVTSGYTGAYETIVKDEHEQVLGTTSERFHTTRDGHGGLVSTNSADAGLLIGRKKQGSRLPPALPIGVMRVDKRPTTKVKAIKELAHRRVIAALKCVNVLCPHLDLTGKRRMVNQILTLSDGKDRSSPRKQITDAQLTEMVWRNMQCIHHRCPMLLFGRQLADELNEFFKDEE